MRLYIVRHGNPENLDYEDDPDPALSDGGRDEATAVGAWMAGEDEVPTIIYASPMTRTQETAELIADALESAGFVRPDIETDSSLGPHMSVKQAIENAAGDKSIKRVCLVTHHEAITAGLRALDEPTHPDPFACAEVRVYKVKRKKVTWKEEKRVTPSDLGLADHY